MVRSAYSVCLFHKSNLSQIIPESSQENHSVGGGGTEPRAVTISAIPTK